jgi:hypothetical protein
VRTGRWLPVAFGLVVLVSAAATVIGWPVWFHLILCCVPVFFALRDRIGWPTAFAAVVIGCVALVQFALVVAPRLHIGMLLAVVTASTVVALVGGAATTFAPTIRIRPTPPRAVWLAALVGPVVWMGALGIASLASGRPRISWTLRGDSANNLLIARDMVTAGGIPVGADGNPAPVAPALLALGLVSGRRAPSGGEALLQTDVGSFALLWLIVIALTCLVAGVSAASLVLGRPRFAAAVAAATSLLPLSWFVSGYQIEFGFFSADVVIVTALLCWLAYAGAERSPAASLTVLLLGGTVMLGTWGPLAAVPVTLAVTLMVVRRRALLRTRGVPLAIVIAGFLQLIAYALVVVLPPALTSSQALTAAGAIYVFAPFVPITIVAATIVLAVVRMVRSRDGAGTGVLALVAGLAVSVGALLYLNRHSATLWTYYPVKCLWLATVVLMVVTVGLLASVLADVVSRSWVLAAASVASLAGVVLFLGATQTVATYRASSAVEHALADQAPFIDDARLAEVSDALAGGEPVVFWRSGLPGEKYLNFWLVQMHAGLAPEAFPLRVAAYGLGPDDTASLCELAGVFGPGLHARTADASLAPEVAEACPSAGITIDRVPAG